MAFLKLKPKNIRRLIVALALLAPFVYLFGNLFAGLCGANGNAVFADDSVDSQTVSLTIGEYLDGSGNLVYDTRYGVSDYLDCHPNSRVKVEGSLKDWSYTYMIFNFYDSAQLWLSSQTKSNNPVIFTSWVNPAFPANASYFRISLYSVNRSDYVLDRLLYSDSSYSNSDYVFGQFFANDNFVSKIGDDVLSDSPVGFEPFADFFKFIDGNMLHMGSTQLGKMAYGYMYWCAHVLVFDFAFMCCTFFITFFEKVFDKFGGSME